MGNCPLGDVLEMQHLKRHAGVRCVVHPETWGCEWAIRKSEASAENTIAIRVGHVSYVPVPSGASGEGQPDSQ